ncbi:MAG: hypothetical protein J6386_08400 [Candidatus Synoicihabitans palmerolidicus]|nr:hypothetical protein [Candidatus Synoicihabitans palmerolidicus]
MDDKPQNQEPKKEFTKLDLSQLQSFSFGTQWTQEKTPKGGAAGGHDDRPRRSDPREPRKDRRGFKRPSGGPGAPGGGGPGGPRPQGGGRGREGQGGPQPGGYRQGGPRQGDGGTRGGGDRRRDGRGPQAGPPPPYISPYFDVTFYPEDTSFVPLAKTIRASCRTFELFDIAKTVTGKNDRFVVVLERKPSRDAGAEKRPFYVSVADGIPFESEDEAINHVMQQRLDKFFKVEQVETDPPKGSFQVINRCGVTGELLGPPNYHLYNQTLQQHHAARLPRMPFETFRNRIESVREQEVVDAWLEIMKKVTRYTWLSDGGAKSSPAETPADTTPDAPTEGIESEAPGAETPEVEATEAAVSAPEAVSFDSLTEAKVYLLTHAREKAVRTYENGRFHGRALDSMPNGEIKRAVLGTLERQQHVPLDTANALRWRLRREGFTIFKKGSKGISYVCAVKRKFRIPGQTFAVSIDELINYIETHPMVKVSELPDKFLGLDPIVEKPVAAEPAAEPEAPNQVSSESADTEAAPAAEDTPATQEVAPTEETATAPAPEAPVEAAVPQSKATGTTSPFTEADQRRIKRMHFDLRWLVTEGYVTEFIDGSLFAAAPLPVPKPKPKPEPKLQAKKPEPKVEAPTVEETVAVDAPIEADAPAAVPESEDVVKAPGAEAEAPAPIPEAEVPATTSGGRSLRTGGDAGC